MTVEDKRSLAATRVTLDGKPAVIGGIRDVRFATVSQLPNGPSYVYAWETVARIVSNGGNFKS